MNKSDFDFVFETFVEMKNKCLCRFQKNFLDRVVSIEQKENGTNSVEITDLKSLRITKYNLTFKLEKVG